MTDSAPDWRWLALRLGGVVDALLDEFAEMCRGSDNREAAQAALAELADAVRSEGQVAVSELPTSVTTRVAGPGVVMGDVLLRDIRVDVFRAGTKCTVWITHLPTGLAVECDEPTSSFRSREVALDKLRALLAADA